MGEQIHTSTPSKGFILALCSRQQQSNPHAFTRNQESFRAPSEWSATLGLSFEAMHSTALTRAKYCARSGRESWKMHSNCVKRSPKSSPTNVIHDNFAKEAALLFEFNGGNLQPLLPSAQIKAAFRADGLQQLVSEHRHTGVFLSSAVLGNKLPTVPHLESEASVHTCSSIMEIDMEMMERVAGEMPQCMTSLGQFQQIGTCRSLTQVQMDAKWTSIMLHPRSNFI